MNGLLLVNYIYIVSGGAVHPLAEVDELAGDRAPRRHRRRDRHAAGRRRHAARASKSSTTSGSSSAFFIGSAIGVPIAYLMPMTAVPQRTALSHAFGALAAALVGTAEYLPAQHAATASSMVALVARNAARLPDLHRQPDGVRQAAGDPAHAADRPTKSQNVVNLGAVRDRGRPRRAR